MGRRDPLRQQRVPGPERRGARLGLAGSLLTIAELVVPGDPVSLQRHRHSGRRTYLPKESVEFRERVQNSWLVAGRPQLGDGPLALSVKFFFARKPSHLLKDGRLSKSAPVFPPKVDCSNLAKGVEDALNGLAFRDDSQIVVLTASKLYADRDEEPRSEVELRALS